VTREDFLSHHGRGLLNRYHNSPPELLTSLYPSSEWLPWKFSKTPKDYFTQKGNIIRYLLWLCKENGFALEDTERWYSMTYDDFSRNCGSGLIQLYDHSPQKLLTHALSELEWLPWKFSKTDSAFWADVANQRRYMHWLGEQLGKPTFEKDKRQEKGKEKKEKEEEEAKEKKSMEEWYSISHEDLLANGGAGLLAVHNGSSYSILRTVFPDIDWLPWKFQKTPTVFWESSDNQRQYMKWLSGVLKREEGVPEQWYSITREDIYSHYGRPLLSLYGDSPQRLLASLYPNSNFLPWEFSKVPNNFWIEEKNQRWYLSWLGRELFGITMTSASAPTKIGGGQGIEKEKEEERKETNEMEAWYGVTHEDFVKHNGLGLLAHYHDSFHHLLAALFPQIDWLPWKFTKAPSGYWESIQHQRKVFSPALLLILLLLFFFFLLRLLLQPLSSSSSSNLCPPPSLLHFFFFFIHLLLLHGQFFLHFFFLFDTSSPA